MQEMKIMIILKKTFFATAFLNLLICSSTFGQQNKANSSISLAGKWTFATDPNDKGESDKWFLSTLPDQILLPGSMTTNGKGDDISLTTPWIGTIVDSTFYKSDAYAKYRVAGNIKIPFWLQPVKYYKGAAWYQKKFIINQAQSVLLSELFIERTHWECTVYLDGKEIGMRNSLAVAAVFEMGKLKPGSHTLTIKIDNRIKDFNVGPNSHSISDHTQSNWNGMIGKLEVNFKPEIAINDIQIYPHIASKSLTVKVIMNNSLKFNVKKELELYVEGKGFKSLELTKLIRSIDLTPGINSIFVTYPMGKNPKLWDEFNPNLYTLKATLSAEDRNEKSMDFGMRKFSTNGNQFEINGRKTFLRGTLECAIFPLTGYPPTDENAWEKIFAKCKEYGLNHVRFHSWCPPEAAFKAADRMGIYLQIECSSWANLSTNVGIGQGNGIDKYIYEESERIVNAYGNHPSFVMMAYGNEPSGKGHVEYLTKFVNFWKAKDGRRLYTTGAGWPVIDDSDFNSTPNPRIQLWGAGLKSIINSEAPKNDYDWSGIISKWKIPTVSHEIGQWCVYPDFKEIKKYAGVLKAKNFEIFQDTLKASHLENLADSFLLASGKLQVLCYKADIEAALRTPNFGGFQLLDLHDFPGQGTALVGVLNPFWEEKGYVTGKEYSQFCNTTVPLVRLPKMVYLNNETLTVPVEIAHFGEKPLTNVQPKWMLKDEQGAVLYSGLLPNITIPVGNNFQLGTIKLSLNNIKNACKLKLVVSVGTFTNEWDIFVYPAKLPAVTGTRIAAALDDATIKYLNDGGNVLLTVKKGQIKPKAGGDVKIGFSSIFWNTLWTKGQAPTTLGVLVDPKHPAFDNFPTEYHSNWQWWDAMSHSNAIILDSVSPGLKPIVRVIDDWFSAKSLGLVFECKIGKGKLIFSSIDLQTDMEKRPEARQLLYSLMAYTASPKFNPKQEISTANISKILSK